MSLGVGTLLSHAAPQTRPRAAPAAAEAAAAAVDLVAAADPVAAAVGPAAAVVLVAAGAAHAPHPPPRSAGTNNNYTDPSQLPAYNGTRITARYTVTKCAPRLGCLPRATGRPPTVHVRETQPLLAPRRLGV